ncbi:DUF6933 domain-containing protein [Fastidiosibacter lacustris]|uniref:DUF6933 domain-containing protein n=1 Tax=Fastidiosibacter lacustris TaxID=2056695 RepID=UPI000E356A3F|nr:hypothetical protein [Fastidiosibacter lacustris]
MAQFRLTAKMASRLKIMDLPQSKEQSLPFYDDWAVDLLKIQRKDVAVFMHVNTRVTLAIPLFEIGGAKYLFDSLPAMIEWAINELEIPRFEDYGCQIRDYFEPQLKQLDFCKTDNRSVTTHLNQFKQILEFECFRHGEVSQIVCNKTMDYWQSALITNPHTKKEYTKPIALWQSYLDGDCINEGENVAGIDNVIPFPQGDKQ